MPCHLLSLIHFILFTTAYISITQVIIIMTSANPQFNGLTAAIEQANIEQVRRLLEVPNAKQLVNISDSEQYNSLFYTIRIPNEEVALQIIKMLLDKGANPYHKEDNQQTILFYLAKEGRAKIIEMLLASHKYDLNDVDKYSQSPLYWAASYGRLKVAELLIKYGVNINHLDINGQTCLFYAARDGQLQMCKFLINRGCKHDLQDKSKKMPLHFAKTFKHPSVIEYLASLKQASVKEVGKSKPAKQSKSVVEAKVQKKKKEVVRNDYVLVYTNDEGMTSEVVGEQLQRFKQRGGYGVSIYDCMMQPELLEQVQIKNQRRNNFSKTATKLIASYIKRPQLQLFRDPVNISIYTDYLLHVEKPMDYSLIRHKLNFNCYENEEEFKEDMLLIYENCVKYNGAESIYGKMAGQFRAEFLQTFRKQLMNSSIYGE